MGLLKRWLVGALVCGCALVSGCVTEEINDATGKPIPHSDSKVDMKSALADYITLANGYMRDGRRDSALRAIKKGLAIDSDSAELHNVLAYYYLTDGENELAEKEYKEALSDDSSYTATYVNYGVFLYRHDRIDEACNSFQKATEDVMYARRDAAFLNYGTCLKKQGKMKEAEEAFRRSYINNARNPQVLLEMAELKFDTGEFDQCKQLYEKFLMMSGQNAQSLWLGIRLAHVMEQPDKVASYALLLKNQFATSPQYGEYKVWAKDK
jgi:type IV pilus assembly protein PilF